MIKKQTRSLGWAVRVGLLVGLHLVLAGTSQGRGANDCRERDWKETRRFRARVTAVADGDTITIETLKTGKDGKTPARQLLKIRMLSIDTPEKHYEGKNQGHWAFVASDRLNQLLPTNTEVEIELDEQACDNYGRMLAHVWREDQNINEQMVREGLAVNYCIFPNLRHCAEYGRWVRENVEARRGMFSDKTVEVPYDWRRRISGRSHTQYVGNLETHAVVAPDRRAEVRLDLRVMFWNASEIREPFYLDSSTVGKPSVFP